jgi:hypothetical protein
MNNTVLVELLGYTFGSIASLILAVWFITLVSRQREKMKELAIVKWYLQLIPVSNQRLRVLPIYGVIAVVIAGLVISLPALSSIRELVQSMLPWGLAIYAIIILVILARRVGHK